MRLLIVTGTHEQPFTRLVEAADRLAHDRTDARVFVQYGAARPPLHAAGAAMLDHAALREEVAAADVVVTHGGPGSILDVIEAGKVPIVCPRDPRFGEHVDGHQQRFVRFLAARERVVALEDPSELASAIDSYVALAPRLSERHDAVDDNRYRLARDLDRWLGWG